MKIRIGTKEIICLKSQLIDENFYDEDYCLKAVESDGDALQYVDIRQSFIEIIKKER